MRKGTAFLGLFVILLVVASCSKFRRYEKSEDWRVKYEAGLRYYEKKDYYRASVLFEQILPIVRGLPEGEKVQFYLAYCQFHDKLYLLASEQFRTFYETYGRSQLAEEARYMYAYSLFASSPNWNLDQSSSIEAMAAMQEYLNRYPNSKFRDQAIKVITTTQGKLERKGFENARQYHKMRLWKSAVVSLTAFQQNFPDSKYMEEAKYLIIDAEFQIAEKSLTSLQRERYQAVIDRYKEFLDEYPQSKFLKDAERQYAESLDKVNSLKRKS